MDGPIAYFENVGQIGYVALILVVMGAVASERSRGTAGMVRVAGFVVEALAA